jgi:hypothetical protein
MVPGFPEYRSLSGLLNELTDAPQPEPGKEYCFPLAGVNAMLVTSKALVFSEGEVEDLKEDIFDQKKIVKNVLNHIENIKFNIPESYNLIKDDLINYEYKTDAMLKTNYIPKSLVIEKVDEKDFESSVINDNSSIDSDSSDCKNDITISFLKDNPFEFSSIFSKNLSKLSIKDREENNNSKVIKLRRDDLVGKFVGHTAIKTRDALMTGLGKVIFIDEAYELYNVTTDSSSDSCFINMSSYLFDSK